MFYSLLIYLFIYLFIYTNYSVAQINKVRLLQSHNQLVEVELGWIRLC